jgi:hypothetical protein
VARGGAGGVKRCGVVHRGIVAEAPRDNRRVHLIVPFAASHGDDCRRALDALTTPALDALIARCREAGRDDGDETSLETPHEHVLARALGWRAEAPWPWAARAAARDGIAPGSAAWGLLTPAHWRVGSDAVHLADPATLTLGEADSRALFEAVRPLFDSEGFALAWGAPLRWYAAHPSLVTLATASLDRVIGRNVDPWLPAQREARLVRRLQNEVQMLLHQHPINAAREAAGALTVNSFWLSGCGVAQAEAAHDARLDARLAAPALAGDWAAWAETWRALDAALPALAPTRLTLCGERGSVSFEAIEPSLWQRAALALRAPRPARERLAAL